jgi:hypothetical protein
MVTLGFKNTSPDNQKARAISVIKKTLEELSNISFHGVYVHRNKANSVSNIIHEEHRRILATREREKGRENVHRHSTVGRVRALFTADRLLTGRILSLCAGASRSLRRVLNALVPVNGERPPLAFVKTTERRKTVEKLMVIMAGFY